MDRKKLTSSSSQMGEGMDRALGQEENDREVVGGG